MRVLWTSAHCRPDWLDRLGEESQGGQSVVMNKLPHALTRADPDIHVDIFTRIIVDGSMLGTLYIRSDLKEFSRRRDRYLLITVLTSGVALLLAYVLALRLQNLITGPVRRLLGTMQQVSAEQDYSLRAPQTSHDELGRLQAGFNAMLEKIQTNNQELEQYRRHLEQLVHERTLEKEKAVDANRAKTRFFAAASHDLRQPLHALNWFLDLLRKRIEDPEAADILTQAQQSVDAMQILFNALLDMSRLEAGVVQPDLKVLALDELCRGFQAEFASRAEQKGLVFHLEVPQLYVESDPLLLERILRNLLGNACKYTEHGEIRLRAENLDGEVCVFVEDSGIGIPEAQQTEVFREFHQVHNPERDRIKGLGLGLSIVQRLAVLLRHPLQLHSEEGRGTTFILTLPQRAVAQRAETDTPAPLPVPVREARILLIDDEALIRDGMGRLLQDWGHRVLTADSGGEAIAQLQQEDFQPELIIADYRLRDNQTGVDAVRRVCELCKREIPAILITGDTLPENLQAARASGYPLLFKPVKPASFRKLIGYQIFRKPQRLV